MTPETTPLATGPGGDARAAVAALARLLARYDDDAWVALANRGLLRRARKDLDALDLCLDICPEVMSADDPAGADRAGPASDGTVGVRVGEHVVRFGPAGPAAATCSCPSAVLCQHVVTAGLWLAREGSREDAADEAATDTTDHTAADTQADATHDPFDDLLALDATALTAHGGLAAYRAAHQLLDDLDRPPAVHRDRYLEVRFDSPPLTVRYLGGGLDGLVLDADVRSPERLRVAAVLAWQRAHGLVLPPPPPPGRAGLRDAAPTEAATSLAASRARLRATVAELLRDAVRVGVSHLSPATEDRLVTAATWAQGVEYHRLARVLRRLGDHVGLLVGRSARADDLALLDELAFAHALVAARDAAAAEGREPAGLVGRARTGYEPVRSLELVGLGGVPWRGGSGYHGLTCVFWSPTRGRMLTWTDARPVSLRGFDPRARWREPGPWTGLTSPAASAGRRLTLTGAQLGPDGRVSGAESTSAAVRPFAAGGRDTAGPGAAEVAVAGLDAVLPVRDTWAGLGDDSVRGLSEPPDAAAAWSVLRPAAVSAARWDAADQTLRWALHDAEGAAVVVEVPWSRLHAHAVGRIEALADAWVPGTLVVARVRRGRAGLVGEPLSLIGLGGEGPGEEGPGRAVPGGKVPVDALHFDAPPRPTRSRLVDALLAAGLPDGPAAASWSSSAERDAPAPVPASVPAPVAALRTLVERTAQRGCAGAAPGSVERELAAAHAAARNVGFTVFGLLEPGPGVPPAELLLRSLYLVQQVERALA